MFREMRRAKQELSPDEAHNILRRGTSGILALSGDDGYPYAVPLSYVYDDMHIYFHCAKSGHKIDAIHRSDKASFCVIDQDNIVPEEYTTYFRSAIAFGKIRIMTDGAEIREAAAKLGKKYAPDDSADHLQDVIAGAFSRMVMLDMKIEHLTGKEAIELIHRRESQ